MMECECISPPPEFDIPPPPDPSLIWHLLSDEPADELIQLQQCDKDEQITSYGDKISSVLTNLPDYLIYALLAIGAFISATLLVVAFRKKRFNRREGRKVRRKRELSADIVLSGGDWPRGTAIRGSNSVINGGDLFHGSSESNFIKHRAIRVTPNSFRSYSFQANKLSMNVLRNNSPLLTGTIFRLHHETSNGYCTIGRLYEEIPGSGIFSAAGQVEHSTAYTARRDPLHGISLSLRRPPPTCPPPPPPNQDSPLSLNSSSRNSMEREHDVISVISSPKRSTDDEKSRNSGNSGDNGRESGYGTAPSRSWNSPMIVQQQRRILLRESDDAFRRNHHASLAIYAHRSNNAHPMTYV